MLLAGSRGIGCCRRVRAEGHNRPTRASQARVYPSLAGCALSLWRHDRILAELILKSSCRTPQSGRSVYSVGASWRPRSAPGDLAVAGQANTSASTISPKHA